MKKLLIIPFLIILSVVPAFAEKIPDWVNGTSSKYPPQNFLIGVGVGDTLDGARSSARAEIAKVFKSRIVQSAQETRSERTAQEGSSSQFSMRQDSASSTAVTTDELLQGVEIAETWQHNKNKTYYALAVLNKQKTRQSLMQQITDQEEIAAGKLSQAKSSSTVIDKLRALNGALDSMNKRDELVTRKRVLDPVSVADISPKNVRGDVERQKTELLANVRFVIVADDTPHLAAQVAEKITSLGFTIVPSAADAKRPDAVVFILSAKTTVTPVDRGNPEWKFYGWHGTLTVTDAVDSNRVIASVVKEGQASHVTTEAAKAKATTEAVQAVADAVEQEMSKYLFGK